MDDGSKRKKLKKSSAIQKLRSKKSAQMLEKIVDLENENDVLRNAISQLRLENESLQQQQKIVLETFEGEGKIRSAMTEWYEVVDQDDVLVLGKDEEKQLVNATEMGNTFGGTCPVEPTITFQEALRDRAVWLVGLLMAQSASGVILSRNEALLANHPVIIFFLTMLVGAGGNAGNQASVRVIRGIALGTLNEKTQNQFLIREFKMAMVLSVILSLAGFIRAAAFRTPLPETVAVTTALGMIVFSSICLGAVLPLFLKRLGVDPAHSSTTIQVVMDILGVILAVIVSSAILDSPLGGMLVTWLTGG